MADCNRYHWLLVASPLLGSSTWAPVATELRSTYGCSVAVPDIVPSQVGEPSHLDFWADQIVGLARQTRGERPLAVVGHGSAAPRMPWLCRQLIDEGLPVAGFIAVDGPFPHGDMSPTEARPAFAGLIDDIVRPDDYLPPWPRWWGTLAYELVPVRHRGDLVADAPLLPREVFDEPIPAVELPPSLRRHFLAFGHGYRDEMERAATEGWRVSAVDGGHLHQLAEPAAVARALVATSAQPAA